MMHPLKAKKALFAYVGGTRGDKRERGGDEVKLMFVDVEKRRTPTHDAAKTKNVSREAFRGRGKTRQIVEVICTA